jgi:hypothetical protein
LFDDRRRRLGRWDVPGFAGSGGTLAAMGLNPFREQRRTAFDIAMVVGAVVVTIGVVLWAMFGG